MVATYCEYSTTSPASPEVDPKPADSDRSLRIYNVLTETEDCVNFPNPSANITTAFVLDDYIVLLKDEVHAELGLVVVSLRDMEILYSREKLFNKRNFMRNYRVDTTHFKNVLTSFRMTTITLYSVTDDDVVGRTLDVGGPGVHGVLQYCKYMAWDRRTWRIPSRPCRPTIGTRTPRWSTGSCAGGRTMTGR